MLIFHKVGEVGQYDIYLLLCCIPTCKKHKLLIYKQKQVLCCYSVKINDLFIDEISKSSVRSTTKKEIFRIQKQNSKWFSILCIRAVLFKTIFSIIFKRSKVLFNGKLVRDIYFYVKSSHKTCKICVDGYYHKFFGTLFNGPKMCFVCRKTLPLKWCVILSYYRTVILKFGECLFG